MERERDEAEVVVETTEKKVVLEELVEPVVVGRIAMDRPPLPGPMVGECLDERHPTLHGRVKLRIAKADDSVEERWVPVLVGVVVRNGDRVFLQQPQNWPEPLVVGVIDGFTERRERERTGAAALELKADEKLEVVSQDGKKLVEVFESENGPVVRVLHESANVEFAGKLSLRAEEIEIEAKEGALDLKARDNVNVKGDVINLN